MHLKRMKYKYLNIEEDCIFTKHSLYALYIIHM